jgi:hypothetical protein
MKALGAVGQEEVAPAEGEAEGVAEQSGQKRTESFPVRIGRRESLGADEGAEKGAEVKTGKPAAEAAQEGEKEGTAGGSAAAGLLPVKTTIPATTNE